MVSLISAPRADEKRRPPMQRTSSLCLSLSGSCAAALKSRALEKDGDMRTHVQDDSPAGFLRSLGWVALVSFGVGFGGYLLIGMTLAT